MADRCHHLAYREAADGEFEGERAYCTVLERFVQPMRADVCNRRYDLAPERHCEHYREHEGLDDEWLADGGPADGEQADGGAPGEGSGGERDE